jgi:hypothetical protein
MWNERNDGGQAFPRAGYYGGGRERDGMSLRDWFAGQALAGICGHLGGASRKTGETPEQADARWSYERADAMLAAREVRS